MRTMIYMALMVLFLPAPVTAAERESPAGEVERTFAVPGEDGVQRADMTGGDYYFKPKWLVLKLGVPVELTVKKEPGFVPHNIVMDSPEADMVFEVDFGKTGEVITFTPTKKGTYLFFCDKKLLFFKSHRKRGMEGVIEVVE